MKRYVFGSAAAVFCAGAMVAAQAPSTAQQQPSQPQSGAQAETRTTAQASTTVTGCVYRESDVPGRTPNVAERAGVLEDYILADVRMSPAAGTGAGSATRGTSGVAGAPGGAAGEPGAGAGAPDAPRAGAGAAGAPGAGAAGAGAAATTGSSASTAGSSAMYKLEFVDDDKLQALVGKRVEVMGRIDREAGDAPAQPRGTTGAGAGAAAPGQPAGQPDRSIGPDRVELPEFEVTSIREMAGTCPATPSAR